MAIHCFASTSISTMRTTRLCSRIYSSQVDTQCREDWTGLVFHDHKRGSSLDLLKSWFFNVCAGITSASQPNRVPARMIYRLGVSLWAKPNHAGTLE